MNMYRLLIVDDEPYTVDGLYELLGESDLGELDLFKAYSPDEALGWLNRVKIDIVLSDIRMPGMDGLQLQRLIKSRWPRCKTIFLTGINEVASIQQAQRDGSVDYILKTEGDEPIIRSVQAAIKALDQELMSDHFLLRAEIRVREALPVLRSEWLRRLLKYGAADAKLSSARLKELDCPLDAETPVLPALARIDRWPEQASLSDRSLLMYGVENMICEYFGTLTVQPVVVDESYVMLLFQPGKTETDAEGDGWERTLRFVQGTLEEVQSTCTRLLKLPLSVACSRGPVGWEEVADIYSGLRNMLVLGIGSGENMLLSDGAGDSCPDTPERLEGARIARLRERLTVLLESGSGEEMLAVIGEWFGGTQDYALYLEAYYTVATELIRQFNRWGWPEAGQSDIRPERLMDVRSHVSRDAAVEYLRRAGLRLLTVRQSAQDERTDRIVRKVNRMIRERIGGDLSLTAIAESVYLNPSYLSVLYKQTTGRNISETIAAARLDKARELLSASPLKIHEVAAAVGFENAGYFTRFFRKHTGISPQEYRDQAGS